jgi:hypothetical protein
VVECGEPAETILTRAHHIDADLIGLGVRGWTDIAKHFRETVAYRILAEAECPVLTHHGAAGVTKSRNLRNLFSPPGLKEFAVTMVTEADLIKISFW